MEQSFTIIPDVHGRPFWRDAVQNIETTPVIFLGDYLDPYPQDHVTWKDSWNGLKDIIDLKRKHPEHVTLLLGNHDVHYYPGYPFFQKGSRYDDVHATRIQNLFLKNLDCFDIAKIIPRSDGHPFLLTHAGIQNSWISEIYHELRTEDPAIHDFLLELSDIKGHPNQIADLFNRALHSQNKNLMKFIMRSLSSISPSRGGRQQGSCVWADFDELKQFEGNLLAGCIQIVGHTRQDSFNQLTPSATWRLPRITSYLVYGFGISHRKQKNRLKL